MSKTKIIGWVLSALLAALLIGMSAPGKFTEWEGKAEAFETFGYTEDLMVQIGVVEVVITLLFLVPRTGFLGAILLTAYLGGATATHVRINDPFYMPIVIGVVVWIAYGLRNPVIFQLAGGSYKPYVKEATLIEEPEISETSKQG